MKRHFHILVYLKLLYLHVNISTCSSFQKQLTCIIVQGSGMPWQRWPWGWSHNGSPKGGHIIPQGSCPKPRPPMVPSSHSPPMGTPAFGSCEEGEECFPPPQRDLRKGFHLRQFLFPAVQPMEGRVTCMVTRTPQTSTCLSPPWPGWGQPTLPSMGVPRIQPYGVTAEHQISSHEARLDSQGCSHGEGKAPARPQSPFQCGKGLQKR